MTKIAKYTILIFLVALQVVYLIEIIERVTLLSNKIGQFDL